MPWQSNGFSETGRPSFPPGKIKGHDSKKANKANDNRADDINGIGFDERNKVIHQKYWRDS